MILCEALLTIVLIAIGTCASYTDCKTGLIPNKALAIASCIGLLINCFYIGRYVADFLLIYLENLAVISLVAFLLFYFHFWSAGDSKLLICMNIVFPARLYDNNGSISPGMPGLIFTFIIAYVFIVFDSVFQEMKGSGRTCAPKLGFGNIKSFLKNYFTSWVYMHLLSSAVYSFNGKGYLQNRLLFAFLFMFAAIMIRNIAFLQNKYMIAAAFAANIWIAVIKHQFVLMPYWYMILLGMALLIEQFVSMYNYQRIKTADAAKGMVLSFQTVMLFQASRIKNLPLETTEDMRTRLTQDQAEAIQKWGKSKQGREEITIVRKIPFAIFIYAGELMFLLVRTLN